MQTGQPLHPTPHSNHFLAYHTLHLLPLILVLPQQSQLPLLQAFPLHVFLPVQFEQFLDKDYFVVLRGKVGVVVGVSGQVSAALYVCIAL